MSLSFSPLRFGSSSRARVRLRRLGRSLRVRERRGRPHAGLILLLVAGAWLLLGRPLPPLEETPEYPLPALVVRPDPGRWADSTALRSAQHALANPLEAGLYEPMLDEARALLRSEIRRRAFPGATLAVGRGSEVVLEQGFGHETWAPGSQRVDPHRSVYDLASLTKVVATTTAAMLLYEDGRIRLNQPVQDLLPEFQGPGKERVTLRHLLTHTSGLPPGVALTGLSPEAARAKVMRVKLASPAGGRVDYSDVGFIVLAEALEAAAGEPLESLLERRVFRPLRMRSTGFRPNPGCRRCVPTQVLKTGRVLRAKPHDPLAKALGGAAGHAGLFSTAHDLARFAAMLEGGGRFQGVRVLRPRTIRRFTTQQAGAGLRTLGWEVPDPKGTGGGGITLSRRAFGHTGFTGTSLWVDPERGIWVVLLTNRVYLPQARNQIQSVRRRIHRSVALAADLHDRLSRPLEPRIVPAPTPQAPPIRGRTPPRRPGGDSPR